MDITFGVIPLIIITSQGYYLIRNFAKEYNSFNRTLRSVLRDIEIASSVFQFAVNKLLLEVMDEHTLGIMMEDLKSEHWIKHDLGTGLEGALGTLYGATVQCIYRTRETLQEVKEILLILSGNAVSHLAKNSAIVATSILKADPFKLEANLLKFKPKDIQTKSTRKKLMGLANHHQTDLQRLRDKLNSQNCEFLEILTLALDNRPGPRPSKLSKVPQAPIAPQALVAPAAPPTASEPQESKNLTCNIAQVCLNSRAVQTSSQRLYRMVSRALLCECHSTHLRLDRQIGKTPIIQDLKGKSKQNSQKAESEPHFSFQMMVKAHGNKSRFLTIPQATRLVFTGYNFQDTDPTPQSNTSIRKMCEDSLSSNEGHEIHLRDTESGNSGFILQRERCSLLASKVSGDMPILSLNDLVASRPAELRTFDRLSIAANLAHSLVHFYSSPWVADWSLHTIQYFEKQEPTQDVGLWTPHLSLKGNNCRRPKVKNREIYLLGFILLQLGGKRLLEISQVEEDELVLNRALRDLCKDMGPKYRNFVRNCLNLWSRESIDLMEDGNLNVFMSHVDILEKQARMFDSD